MVKLVDGLHAGVAAYISNITEYLSWLKYCYSSFDILASLILHRKNKVKHMAVEAPQTDIIQVMNSSCFLP